MGRDSIGQKDVSHYIVHIKICLFFYKKSCQQHSSQEAISILGFKVVYHYEDWKSYYVNRVKMQRQIETLTLGLNRRTEIVQYYTVADSRK